MILAEDIEPYISEPDNIYDLAGNCFVIIPEGFEPSVRILRATVPGNVSQSK